MTSPTTLTDAIRVASEVSREVSEYRACGDRELTDRAASVAELRRLVDAHAALVAGEVARRSSPDLGGAGLVQRAGHRTVEDFVKTTIGVTGRDAAVLTRVGRMTQGSGPVGAAVANGTLGAASAESIRAGLGEATVGVPVEVLDQVAERRVRKPARWIRIGCRSVLGSCGISSMRPASPTGKPTGGRSGRCGW